MKLPPNLQIRTGTDNINLPWLLTAMQDAGMVLHYTMPMLMRATENSLCFSAWIENSQVGFARVITDRATSSLINDVVVDKKWREKGIGTALMQAALGHPLVSNTICILHTRWASDFYQKFGFVPVGGMLKRDPK